MYHLIFCGIFYRTFGRRNIAQVLRCLWRHRKAGGQGKNLELGRHMRRPRQFEERLRGVRHASSISAYLAVIYLAIEYYCVGLACKSRWWR